MKDHCLKWQAKINKLDAKLESSVTRIKKQKQKCQGTIQQQIDEAANQEYELTCSIQDLEEVNVAHIEKYKDCIKQQKPATKQSKWHREQATKQLVNWREERNARRDLQDEIARLSKVTANQKMILERYEAMIEQSEVTNKKEMKKEWDKDCEAGKRGGSRSWPVWVVQLICELLVNGTPHTAIPGNISVMYESLYGEEPDKAPSISFCQHCRVTVQVVGETMAALRIM